MSETRQGVLPTPSAFPGSMCRRISITHWTWSLASSLGKLWLYSHCPKLNRMLTFCHLVSALCSEMTLKTQKLKKNHKHEKFKPDHMELFTPYKKVFEVGCNGTSAPHDGTKTIATNIALPPCTVKTQELILCTLWLFFLIWKVYKSCIMHYVFHFEVYYCERDDGFLVASQLFGYRVSTQCHLMPHERMALLPFIF